MSDRPSTRPDEDARAALSARASADAARNAPRSLPLIAAVALAGTIVYFGMQVQALASANDRLDRQKTNAGQVARLVSEITTLRTQAASGSDTGGVGAPLTDALRRFQTAADRSGVEIGTPNESSEEYDGVTERTYSYRLQGQQIDQALGWIDRAQNSIDGLEVKDIDVRPAGRTVRRGPRGNGNTNTGWNVSVTFRRLERQQ